MLLPLLESPFTLRLANVIGMFALVAGIVLSVIIAWLIGLVTLRLKGHFLALAPLA